MKVPPLGGSSSRMPAWCLLVAAWAALVGWAAGEDQPVIVCTSNWAPMASCSPQQPSWNYTGFDVEAWREAVSLIGWQEGLNYTFECLPWDDMIADLTAPNGRCFAAAAGITVTTKRREDGIEFSYPTYRSALAVLFSNAPPTSTGWGFIRPFAWDVWLAVGLTVVLFPLIAFVIEFLSIKGRIRRSEMLPGYTESAMRSFWTILLYEPLHLSSFGGRVATLCYGFLAVILINTYCANLAASLTVNSINSHINSVSDLRGKAVSSEKIYLRTLRNEYGIFSSVVDSPTVSLVAQALTHGNLTAYITDEPVVRYAMSTLKDCTLTTLPDTIVPFDYAFAFRNGTDLELRGEIDNAIMQLQEDGFLTALKQSLIADVHHECNTDSTMYEQKIAIKFSEVYGLWVILGAGIAFGALAMAFTVWQQQREWQRSLVSGAADSNGTLPGGPSGRSVSPKDSGAAGGPAKGKRKGLLGRGFFPFSKRSLGGPTLRTAMKQQPRRHAQQGQHRPPAAAAGEEESEGGADPEAGLHQGAPEGGGGSQPAFWRRKHNAWDGQSGGAKGEAAAQQVQQSQA